MQMRILIYLVLALLIIPASYPRNSLTPPAMIGRGLDYYDQFYCKVDGSCTMTELVVGNLTVNDRYMNITVTNFNVTGNVDATGNFSGHDLYVYGTAYIHELTGLSPISILDENLTQVGNISNGLITMQYFKGDGSELYNLDINETGTLSIDGDLYMNQNFIKDVGPNENHTITISGGQGFIQFNDSYPSSSVVQVTIIPQSSTNSYYIKSESSGGLEKLITEPAQHTGNTVIPYQFSASSTFINFSLTDVSIDENILIRVRWKN